MSSEALSRLIARANADGAFRHELVGDPQGVGAANGLSIEELDALMSGDSARLRQVGVSEELSHFTLVTIHHEGLVIGKGPTQSSATWQPPSSASGTGTSPIQSGNMPSSETYRPSGR